MFKVLKFKNAFIGVVVIMLIGIMTIFPTVCVQGAKEGLMLSLFTVFPSVFPFMVLSRYITLSGVITVNFPFADKLSKFIFGLPKEALMPFILGTISGYPTGCAVICDMVDKKIITKDEGEHLLPFCNNCSPLFIMGTVGNVIIGNTYVGYVLFLVHIISAIITGMILKSKVPYKNCRNDAYIVPANDNPFSTAVSSSVNATLTICGYITLFSVITKIIIFANENFTFACGFLEMTNGINHIAGLNIPTVFKLAIISAILGFSGICVLLQTDDFTSKRNMSVKKYFWGKFIFSIISFILTFAIFSGTQTVSVFNPCAETDTGIFGIFSILLTMLTILLISLKNKLQ